MPLGDRKIRELLDSGVIEGGDTGSIGPVSYDLATEAFHTVDGKSKRVELAPGDSVFVSSVESINLPDDITADVRLRNSRIRLGLSLDAPLYFPGHHTRVFYRVTNVSANAITLDTSKGIAQLVFERVDGGVDKPYRGSFADEFDYTGLGRYESIYADDYRKVSDKLDEVKGIERRMYGNVLAIMAIIAAVFTLVNVNVGSADVGLVRLLACNLSTVGSFAALVALIAGLLKQDSRRAWVVPTVVAVVAFIAAALVLALL